MFSINFYTSMGDLPIEWRFIDGLPIKNCDFNNLPSGKHRKNYGQSQFLMGKCQVFLGDGAPKIAFSCMGILGS